MDLYSVVNSFLGNLQPGDQILEVNGESLIGVTSERYAFTFIVFFIKLLFYSACMKMRQGL